MSLDPDLVAACLTAEERAAIASLLETAGLEERDWVRILGLRNLIEAVAVMRVSAGYGFVENAAERVQLAAEDLGADEGDPRIANTLIRRLHRWMGGPGVARLTKSQKPFREAG